MNKNKKFEHFVDYQLLNLINNMESDVKRRLYSGKKADALQYVVIELFLRAGFAKQYYQPNGRPGWVITERGLAELRELAQDEDEDVDDDNDNDEGEDKHELVDNPAQARDAKGKTETH